MACNTPIIASFDQSSDLAEILKDAGAGLCVRPGNPNVLSKAILKIYEGIKIKEETSSDIRAYVEKTASKEICLHKYINKLKQGTDN